MSVNLGRLRALPVALAVAAAVPLLAPVAADAALAGGNALTTTLRPDLRSATVTRVDPVAVETDVTYCFNKSISSLPQPGSLGVGLYRDSGGPGVAADSAVRSASNDKCAVATFSSFDLDAEQYTYASVAGSDGAGGGGTPAVTNIANGLGNIQDATALIGSKTNNGTRGRTTGPDLVGITANNANNTIDYTFDQTVGAVNTAAPPAAPHINDAGHFGFNDSTGVAHAYPGGATNISINGKVVRVKFPVGDPVSSAVRAFVGYADVTSLARGDFTPGGSATRPGSGGFTDRPDLVDAVLSSSGNTVDFVYDQLISTNADTNGKVLLSLSIGGVAVSPSSSTVVNGNTLRATFTSGDFFNEYDVQVYAGQGAVTGGTGASTAGGAAVGGNTGAFAQGFTTAPDARAVSFDTATGVASVTLDQRFVSFTPGSFKLLDDSGSQIAPAAISVSGQGGAAGPVVAKVTFTPAQLTGARSLLLQSGAFSSFIGSTNPAQVISPTAGASKVKGKFHKARSISKKAMRRAMARVRH
jgi:hypothetical protein